MASALVAEITTEVRKQISAENSESARKLSEKGWVYAGSLYREMARIKDAVRNATQSRSEYLPGTGTLDSKLTGDVLSSANAILARHKSLAGRSGQPRDHDRWTEQHGRNVRAKSG